MSRETEVDDCTRRIKNIDGENYYLIVGDEFVMATVPRENDPEMSKTRMIVETLCSDVTKLMEKRNNQRFGVK